MRQNHIGTVEARVPEIPLTRERVLERLLASEPKIRALGVQRLALFGSTVRGEARVDSDVDLLVQFLPGQDLQPLLSSCRPA